jgi:hypothetical protein
MGPVVSFQVPHFSMPAPDLLPGLGEDLYLSPPEPVDGLLGIAHVDDVAMLAPQQLQDLLLQGVGILKLVYYDVTKLTAVSLFNPSLRVTRTPAKSVKFSSCISSWNDL